MALMILPYGFMIAGLWLFVIGTLMASAPAS